MRKISKGSEPASLTAWKRRFPQSTYNSMSGLEQEKAKGVRNDIRSACTREQYYLCAYCCQEITGQGDNTSNEHIIPQSTNASKSLDYNNIIASCQIPNQCDRQHKSQVLLLHPLMGECETEINYGINGSISGTSPRAETAITVLGLNNKSITNKRKQAIEMILFNEGFKIEDILELEDRELLDFIVEDLEIPQNGKFLPFAPVIINALKTFMKENN